MGAGLSGRGRAFAHCEALAEQFRKGGTGAPLRGNKRISTRSTNERVHTLGGAVPQPKRPVM